MFKPCSELRMLSLNYLFLLTKRLSKITNVKRKGTFLTNLKGGKVRKSHAEDSIITKYQAFESFMTFKRPSTMSI